MIPTVAVLDADKLHAVFAVTVREMLPELPAWNVMFSPVTADVIVPPVICHVWVMPERAERFLDEPLRGEWLTLGMVEGLCDAARAELVRSPERSLHIAQLAAAMAEALPESYPQVMRAQMQAQSWKAVSNAHWFTSRYPASLLALDLADRRIAKEPALAHDRATLSMARALTLQEMDRTTEALMLLDAAREILRNYRDLQQVAQCELVIGMTQYRLGKLGDARQAFMRVIPVARAAGDLHTVAAAYNNLGRTAADAGDVNGAVDALQQARAIFREPNCSDSECRKMPDLRESI